jgi:hypothetical protein
MQGRRARNACPVQDNGNPAGAPIITQASLLPGSGISPATRHCAVSINKAENWELHRAMDTHVSRDPHSYWAGQKARESGIYAVIHAEHRHDHEVLAIRGEEFPSCLACGREVTFHLVRPIPHMTYDIDLSGPRLSLLKSARPAE